MRKPGDRVGAIQKSSDKTVHFYGYGVYEGRFPFAIFGGDEKFDNPRIKLDNGGTVWGCECWWGPEESIKRVIEGKEIIEVSTKPSTE